MKKTRRAKKYLRKDEQRCPCCDGYRIVEDNPEYNNGFDSCDVCEGTGTIKKEFDKEYWPTFDF